ncbi:MAG: Transcriptional regulator, LysR family [Labilithrix sp.]|nr:Transcriptional regulator, LysR family [Labilithrix sp.]
MDLNRVSAFVRVVHDGSFTAAARALGLPKSSISRSVAQLEQDLGIRLLHRTTRQLHLTDAGAAFYERVSRALGDIDEATSAASDAQEELSGVVRITAPVDLGVWSLAPIVARFVRKNPKIRVELSLTGRVVDLVGEGFDLAVRAGPLRDSSLIARRVGALESVAYASPKYIERRGRPEEPSDVAAHDCVVFRPTNGKASWDLTRADGTKAVVEVTGPIATDDMSFVRKAVLAGAGIGVLPTFLCARAEQAGRLVRVLPGWALNGAVLHVAYPSARFVPQRVVVLREYLFDELGKIGKAGAIHEAARAKGHAAPKRAKRAKA